VRPKYVEITAVNEYPGRPIGYRAIIWVLQTGARGNKGEQEKLAEEE